MSSSGTAQTHRAEQVGPLGDRRADQQPAVRAAGDRRAARGRVYLLAISHSAAAMKSSKTFCLLLEHAGVVPLLAELAAAAQVRDGVHAAALEPRERRSPRTPGVWLDA